MYIKLVNIKKTLSNALFDIRYASPNNFTGKAVYPSVSCYLHGEAASALQNAHQDLQKIGLNIKIWDAYRPLSVQKKFWEIMPDQRYVADPAVGSRHNRGCAVDCTLVDQMGNELLMPTEFDDFSERAHRDYMNLSAEIIKNRELLESIMLQHGFEGLPTEWWHFDYKNWQNCPVLDIDFEELENV